jgi:hypothetical protein
LDSLDHIDCDIRLAILAIMEETMNLKKLTKEILVEKWPEYISGLDIEETIGEYPYYDADQKELYMYSEQYARHKGYELPGDRATLQEFNLVGETQNKVKEIFKAIHRWSEEDFHQEYNNNVYFHKGFDTLVNLLLAKEER